MHCCAFSKEFRALLTAAPTLLKEFNKRVGSRQRSDHIHSHIHSHRGSEMVTMVQEEGYTTSRPIPSIVHSKFTARQLHIPVILSRVNKMPQHILQRLSVSTLSLFVRLWVRCSGHTLVKAKQVTDFNKELRGEEPILIRHQELGDPMQPEYLSHKDLSKLRSTHVIPARSKMHHLAQPVHKHHNKCVASCWSQAGL